jgi:hypothetical protein
MNRREILRNNYLFLKDINDLTEEDKENLKLMLEIGFIPLCDWHDFEKRITMTEHAGKLRELLR